MALAVTVTLTVTVTVTVAVAVAVTVTVTVAVTDEQRARARPATAARSIIRATARRGDALVTCRARVALRDAEAAALGSPEELGSQGRNTQENTNMLIAYQIALEVVGELRPLVEQLRKHDATLAKQLVDAASSTVQNLAEGMGHRGGDRRLKWEIAFGEASEIRGSLEVARAWGYVLDDRGARDKLDCLLALCWGLTKGTARPSARR